MSLIRGALGSLLAVSVIALFAPAASGSDFRIVPDSVTVEVLDAEGNPDYRAGAHPSRLRIGYGLDVDGTGTSAKHLLFDISPGLASIAGAVPMCTRTDFDKPVEGGCPPSTQVGVLTQKIDSGEDLEMPIYNIEPAPNEVAMLGAKPFWTVPLRATLRPEDYGLTLGAMDLFQFPSAGGQVELWGVPADHQEDTAIPRKPFLTTPTRCAPVTITVRAQSWQVGAPWLSETGESSVPFEDCENLPFSPKLNVDLTNPAIDSPTGVRIDFTMPEDDDPDGRASAHIENATVEFPEGIGISPGGAEGLLTCADAQFGLGTAAKATCPASSRIGSVTLESPQLRTGVTGDLYLGEEHPGNRFRMLVATSERGIDIKLVSSLHVDSTTGRLSASLTKLPQTPISLLSLKLNGGGRALLATPLTCGQSVVGGRLEPYSGGAPVDTTAPIAIGSESPCPRAIPFAPEFVAGTASRRAGRSTTFSMTLRRQDGEQIPSRLAVTLPRGLTGTFGRVERCPGAAAEIGACPANSKIGGAVAEVGSGPNPAAMQGNVYLTDAYRRAPFGLAILFRATIGPFDLGTIVTRATVELDRHTGQMTVRTDPLPEIVGGVPIRFRTLGIDIDRPGLIRNPTSCAPRSIQATVLARGGSEAAAKSSFALGGCHRLGFRPRFAIAFTGGPELHKRGRPGLSISARPRPRDTNIRAMQLSLPRLLKFDASNLQEICSRQDARVGLCSPRARVGEAHATTPLLSEPLRGPIHIVQPGDDGLPDLWLSLKAMGVEVNLRGVSTKKNGRFVTRMVDLPDMPLSAIKMRFPHGRNSIFTLGEALCAGGRSRNLFVPVAVEGQDDAFRSTRVVARPRCAHGIGTTSGKR